MAENEEETQELNPEETPSPEELEAQKAEETKDDAEALKESLEKAENRAAYWERKAKTDAPLEPVATSPETPREEEAMARGYVNEMGEADLNGFMADLPKTISKTVDDAIDRRDQRRDEQSRQSAFGEEDAEVKADISAYAQEHEILQEDFNEVISRTNAVGIYYNAPGGPSRWRKQFYRELQMFATEKGGAPPQRKEKTDEERHEEVNGVQSPSSATRPGEPADKPPHRKAFDEMQALAPKRLSELPK